MHARFRSANRSSNDYRQILQRSTRQSVESLEPRRLFSVVAASLYSAELVPGTLYTYHTLDNTGTDTGDVETISSIGATSFHGSTAFQVDTSATNANQSG